MTSAQQLRAIKEDRNWTVERMRELLNVDRITVQRWLRQARKDDGEELDGNSMRQPHKYMVAHAELLANKEEGV